MGDTKEIEKVRKGATKLIINLKHMSYTDRLLRLKLPTLKYRRLRGDMIDVFKITHNIQCKSKKIPPTTFVNFCQTAGNF